MGQRDGLVRERQGAGRRPVLLTGSGAPSGEAGRCRQQRPLVYVPALVWKPGRRGVLIPVNYSQSRLAHN